MGPCRTAGMSTPDRNSLVSIVRSSSVRLKEFRRMLEMPEIFEIYLWIRFLYITIWKNSCFIQNSDINLGMFKRSDFSA